jgi:hypothetical protein
LIDDGIGTPVLLQNQSIFKYKIKFQIRLIITEILLSLYSVKLYSINNILPDITHYYTIYKNISFRNNECLSIVHLNLYEKEYRIVENETCFIGSPMMEFNLCKQGIYRNLLIEIKKKYGNFKYFLHPDEYIALSFRIEGIEFIKLNQSIENYFGTNGIPKNVISFVSSAILNLANSKNAFININFRYIKMKIYGSAYDELYYKILEQHNIIDSGITI